MKKCHVRFRTGDKVILKKTTLTTLGFKVGDICTITSLNANGYNKIEIENNISIGYVSPKWIEKVVEEE